MDLGLASQPPRLYHRPYLDRIHRSVTLQPQVLRHYCRVVYVHTYLRRSNPVERHITT